MLWIACSLALLTADQQPTNRESLATGCQWQAASDNFAVRNFHPRHDARKVAAHCELWRAKLQKYWTAGEQPAWSQKCEVVVHANSGSYLAAVGAGAGQTFGSSLIKF